MSEVELEYYRAVEDLFARLRGTPFLVSPKDFALLRRWWGEGVPLAAVAAGLGEVFARRAEQQADPVSSLSYCRHAVGKHAKRLAAAAIGSEATGGGALADLTATVGRLTRDLGAAAARWEAVPAVAAVLRDVARSVATMPLTAEAAAADEALGQLELAALDALSRVLPGEEQARIDRLLAADLAGLQLDGEAHARTSLALRRKHVRAAAGLPRLEVTPDDR